MVLTLAATVGVTRIPPEVIVFVPESVTVSAAAVLKRSVFVVTLL